MKVNYEELKHIFNLFVDSLDTLIPDKLTLIKLAIGNVVVDINDIKNIELDIKYIFTIWQVYPNLGVLVLFWNKICYHII